MDMGYIYLKIEKYSMVCGYKVNFNITLKSRVKRTITLNSLCKLNYIKIKIIKL